MVLLALALTDASAWTDRYDRYFQRYGQLYFPFHPWQWWKAQAAVESSLNPLAVSPAGAMGLMQLMPETARWLGVRDAFVPELAIEAGIRYDRWLWRLWQKRQTLPYPEDLCFVFASYNAGPGRVLRVWRGQDCREVLLRLPSETRQYVRRIDRIFTDLCYE